MRENILETRFMDLGSITLQMVTVTRVRGMKVVNKAMECIPSDVQRQDVVNGMPVPLSTLFPS